MNADSIFREKCTILALRRSHDSCLLTFRSDHIAEVIRPGQFVNILPPSAFKECVPPYRIIDPDQDMEQLYNPEDITLLRRPFSMHRVRVSEETKRMELSVVFRVIGKGTRLIAGLEVGQSLDILGPLGSPFPMPDSVDQPVFIIAGGFGIAPLIPLAELLSARMNPVTVLWGVTDIEGAPLALSDNGGAYGDLCGLALSCLDAAGIPSLIASDRKSKNSFHGTVCELFLELLALQGTHRVGNAIVYTCGPEIMMQKVTQCAQEKNWKCRVSLEKYMACGIGACMSCVCKIKTAHKEHSYSRTCAEGPSFWGDEVVWEK